MMRSFSTKLSLLVSALVLTLPGCVTMEQISVDLQKSFPVTPIPVTHNGSCYQVVRGTMQFLNSVSCGANSDMMVDWLQAAVKSQNGYYETNRVSGEYQVALTNNVFGNTQFKIRTTIPDGSVLIDLRIFPTQYVRGSNIQCRSFFEQILVNGNVSANTNRTACREIPNKWFVLVN